MIRGKIKFKPRWFQEQIMTCPKRHRAAVLHRRAGKTVMAVFDGLETMFMCPLPQPRVYYVAPFLKQAKKLAWDYLATTILNAGKPHLFEVNKSELSVTFVPNGGRFQLLGANDNIDAIRGVYADKVICDELADMHPGLWSNVIRPALADRRGRALMLGTPRGRMNFLYELSKTDADDPEWQYFCYRCRETGVLPEDEIQSIFRDMQRANPGFAGALFAQEMECSFAAAVIGAVYGKGVNQLQGEGRFTVVKYDPNLPVSTAWDLGYKDATAIFYIQQLGTEIRIIEYEEHTFTALPEICRHVLQKPYVYKDHIGPHDLRVRELGSGRSRLEIASEFGVDFIIAPNWSIEEGIEAVQGLLPNLWIDNKLAERALDALANYKFEYDDKHLTFKTKPCHDWTSHGCDALRYYAIARDPALGGHARDGRWLF